MVEASSECIGLKGNNKCHSLCDTCRLCGDIFSCKSCKPNHYQVSNSFYDEEFQCMDKCETTHMEIRFKKYSYCPLLNAVPSLSTNSTKTNDSIHNGDYSFIGLVLLIFLIFNALFVLVAYKYIKRFLKKLQQPNSNAFDVEMNFIKLIEKDEEPKIFEKQPMLASNRLKKEDISKPQNAYNNLRTINADEFIQGEKISHGNFSKVYEAKLNDEDVAMKVASSKDGRKSIHKELQIYDKISHLNILQAIGVHFGLENILFLPLRKFNFKEYLIDYGETERICPQILSIYCIQITNAMNYLHKMDILHCDLKIDNILIKDDEGKLVEIADFGCAVDINHDHDARYVGTLTHTAYELLKAQANSEFQPRATKSSDVWAFAITVWQIFSKGEIIPKDFQSPKQILENYEKGRNLPMPKLMPLKIWRYVLWECFDLDPQCRPSMGDLYRKFTSFSSPE